MSERNSRNSTRNNSRNSSINFRSRSNSMDRLFRSNDSGFNKSNEDFYISLNSEVLDDLVSTITPENIVKELNKNNKRYSKNEITTIAFYLLDKLEDSVKNNELYDIINNLITKNRNKLENRYSNSNNSYNQRKFLILKNLFKDYHLLIINLLPIIRMSLRNYQDTLSNKSKSK